MGPAEEDLEEQYKIYQQLHPLTQDLATLNEISQTVSLPLKWDVMLTTTVEQIVNEHDLKAIYRLYLASIGEPNLLTLLSPPKYRDTLAQIIERFKTNTILQEGNGYAKY